MNIFSKLLIASTLLGSPLLAKLVPSQKAMLTDVDFIDRAFHDGYAAADWKYELTGWNLEDELSVMRRKIQQTAMLDFRGFQQLIKNFCISVRDYHVGVSFYSTEMATLPFRVRGSEGRYFFSYVDEDAIKYDGFPFVEGDEIFLFDGVPIERVISELRQQEVGYNHDLTDNALAELYLTSRFGSLGHTVPKGAVKIVGKRQSKSKKNRCTVSWDYTPEKMVNAPFCTHEKSIAFRNFKKLEAEEKICYFKKKMSDHPFFFKQFAMPQFSAMERLVANGDHCSDMMGSRKSFIPLLGSVIWESDEDFIFHAYVFETSKGEIAGYIRIPSFKPANVDAALAEFAGLIDAFEEETDLLIIDQINNPGGYLLYVYALASMLANQPLSIPKQQIMFQQADVFFAHESIPDLLKVQTDEDAVELIGETMEGIPVDYQVAQSLLRYFEFIVNEWNDGHHLTRPIYPYGLGPILPHPSVHYSKPLLVLINSLDFSGGDFFPAILQDSRRATLLGTRTAGAGGFLESLSFPNTRGVAEIFYTGSIAKRKGDLMIENNGVSPDIIYQIGTFDLQNNYANYVLQIQKTLNTLTK